MKKKLLLIPLFVTLLCGCTLEDLMFWKTKDNEQGQKDNNKDKGDDDTAPSETTIHVTGVSLGKGTLSLEEMKHEQLTYTVSPNNATNKNVQWSTSDGAVASVVNGLVSANNPGTATITVTTEDGNKTASCYVTVTAKEIVVDTVTRTLNFDTYCTSVLDLKVTQFDIQEPAVVDENVNVTFAKNDGATPPRYIKGESTKKYEARPYAKNSFTFSSINGDIREIVLTFSTDKPGTNTLTPDVGSYDADTNKWTGKSKTVEFTVEGTSGHRRISEIKVVYEGSEPDPEEDINLGVMSIGDVREYISAKNIVTKNKFGNGVNEHRMVTIKGYALAKIDLVKTKSSFGLDVSEPAKVIMADATGYIGVATEISGDGTTLWGKIDNHVNQSTSKYIVTGYLSEYLGHPEILVTSFQWDQNLEISLDFSVISDANADIDGFYSHAKDIYYNCAGHGYGEVLTLSNLKCYYSESGGSGRRFYNFTDGENNLRVNAYNLSTCTMGHNYNIVGIVSLKDLSPVIFAFNITSAEDQTEILFDYASVATSTTVADFRTNFHGDQDDVDTRPGQTRFDETIGCFENVYSVHGYLAIITENNKLYVGISQTYKEEYITGKTNAMANGILLIENDQFWNRTEEELALFNALYEDYMFEDNPLTLYFVPRQQGYKDGSVCWQVLLIPDFINGFSN